MKTTIRYVLTGLVAIAATAALFSWAQVVTRNDHRLLQADDEKRTRMLARSCGARGQLMQDPLSRQYSCLYVNPDGDALLHAIADAPLLVVQR